MCGDQIFCDITLDKMYQYSCFIKYSIIARKRKKIVTLPTVKTLTTKY